MNEQIASTLLFIDSIISCLQTIHDFQYISAPGTTVVATPMLVKLQLQIDTLKKYRTRYVKDYSDFLNELPQIIESITKD